MKNWIKMTITTEWEQNINIEPTPEFDGLNIWFSELDGTHKSPTLCISTGDLPIIIEKLQEMMDYAVKK